MDLSTFMTLTKKIDSSYKKRSEPIAQKFGISSCGFDIIMFLHNNPKYYTAKDISDMRRLKPNVLSNHIERLVNDGYLIRMSVPGDRRKIKLVNTPKAMAVVELGLSMQKEFFDDLLRGMSQEDIEHFKQCIDILSKNAAIM